MSSIKIVLDKGLKKLGRFCFFIFKSLLFSFEKIFPLRWLIGGFNRFNDWLFGQGTRVVEFINSALLLGFALPFIYNLDGVLRTPAYSKFHFTSNSVWLVCMMSLGLLQAIAMLRKGVQSNQISGFLLIISGWVWGVVSSFFLGGSPPVTTAPVVYGIIAFVCTVAGLYLLKYNKKIEDVLNKGR